MSRAATGTCHVARGVTAMALTAMLVLPIGCGQRRPVTFEVAGMVTIDGKPVPVGEIVFSPDPAKGHDGLQARATIRDGAYRTPPGEGHIGGPMVIVLRCYDGVPAFDSPQGLEMLKQPYTMSHDLPREASTLDIAVPASIKRATPRR
ncbi:MAG: hypothetical protein ACKOEX_01630 [Planctomycetia bacterium]